MTQETERPSLPDLRLITEQNLEPSLHALSDVRETPGFEEPALAFADQLIMVAKGTNNHYVVGEAMLNKYLTRQHQFSQIDDSAPDAEDKKVQAVKLMEDAVNQAKDYIETNNVEASYYTLNRALGRLADIKGDHAAAKTAYTNAKAAMLPNPDNLVYQAGTLELDSHILASRIYLKEPVTAAEIVDLTNQFDSSPNGRALKEANPYVWYVWKSGMFQHVGEAYAATEEKQKGIDYLNHALDMLATISESERATLKPGFPQKRYDQITKSLQKVA